MAKQQTPVKTASAEVAEKVDSKKVLAAYENHLKETSPGTAQIRTAREMGLDRWQVRDIVELVKE